MADNTNFENDATNDIKKALLFDAPAGISDGFDDTQKQKDLEKEKQQAHIDEINKQIAIVDDAYFNVWKTNEKTRELKKRWLFWTAGVITVVQIIFIMGVVLASALSDNFYISDTVFVSVIFATLVQVIAIVKIITSSLFDNKNDKFFAFISQWINKTKPKE